MAELEEGPMGSMGINRHPPPGPCLAALTKREPPQFRIEVCPGPNHTAAEEASSVTARSEDGQVLTASLSFSRPRNGREIFPPLRTAAGQESARGRSGPNGQNTGRFLSAPYGHELPNQWDARTQFFNRRRGRSR